MSLEVEFTVEPFVAGDPGPHVQAALDTATVSDLRVEFGPFGTVLAGDDDDRVLAALDQAAPSRRRAVRSEPR